MGTNDVIALEANFKGWKENRFPIPPKDLNLFEYYCTEQFLRSFDLSDSQLKSGMTGGGGDGGSDAMYMFVNGELIDAESELDPKTPNDIKLLIMQVKEGPHSKRLIGLMLSRTAYSMALSTSERRILFVPS